MNLSPQSIASSLLVLFIPSHDREDQPINHQYWVDESLSWLGQPLGGATAFPQGQGVWRDDTRGGRLLYDKPTIMQCYTTDDDFELHAEALREFLLRMCVEANQAAVACVYNNEMSVYHHP